MRTGRGHWPFPKLPARHRAWVAAKLLVSAWQLLYAAFTPAVTASFLGAFIWIVASVTTIGVLVSIAGMLTAMRPGHGLFGRVTELSGLALAGAGPAVHAITMGSITVGILMFPDGSDPTARIGPMLQSVAIAAFLAVRYVEVRTRATSGVS
ncbi:hypothetical protein QE428_002588 [Microbacterium sp. SORGH_AS 505]|nr:hypothetical protein [Microbacterium sp. SORGH_AS_0505]